MQKSWRRCAVAVLALSLATAGPGPSYADPREDKARVDAELAKTLATLEGLTEKAQRAALALADATKQLPIAQENLAEATGRLAAARADAHAAEKASAAATVVADGKRVEFTAAQDRVEQARSQLARFITAAYKGSRLGALNALMSATSPSAVAEDLAILDHLAGQQQAAVDQTTTQRLLAKQSQNAAEVAEAGAAAARVEAQRSLAAAAAAEAEAKQAADRVAQLARQKQTALADANAQRAAVQKEYAELKAESDRIAAELRNVPQPVGTTPKIQPGARFLTPVSGWKSSDYGWRYDPFYRVWQLHAGVDLAAGGGTPIYAAAAGRVLRAGWNGGYGNYTCIVHGTYQGKSLATCYAHQSQILVHAGQQVSRGQMIGRVGTTGASTGYHLHLEVRLNGDPVQPLGWLPECVC